MIAVRPVGHHRPRFVLDASAADEVEGRISVGADGFAEELMTSFDSIFAPADCNVYER